MYLFFVCSFLERRKSNTRVPSTPVDGPNVNIIATSHVKVSWNNSENVDDTHSKGKQQMKKQKDITYYLYRDRGAEIIENDQAMNNSNNSINTKNSNTYSNNNKENVTKEQLLGDFQEWILEYAGPAAETDIYALDEKLCYRFKYTCGNIYGQVLHFIHYAC